MSAGVVVAVAAGNSGPGASTVESPGRASKVITVAASTNKHFVGQPFTYPAGGGTTIGAAVGDFDRAAGTVVRPLRHARPMVAPALTQALQENWRSLIVGRARSARRSRTPKRRVPSVFSLSTTSLEIPLQWLGRPALMTTCRRS